MDLHIRKYVLFKAHKLEEQRKELFWLNAKREELRQNVIDASAFSMDGQPHGKGGTTDVTSNKAMKLLEIDRRIKSIKNDLSAFESVEKRLKGHLKQIYDETIVKECTDLDAKAMICNCGRAQLIRRRGKILTMIAKELGEYIDIEELEDWK